MNEAERAVSSITEHLGVPPLIARILLARGITSPEGAKLFLKPRLENLSDPFLLPDAEKGVLRLADAIRKKETICIYGDYDADGVSCLALMVNFLRHFGVFPHVHIPTREEGYGLHVEAVKDIEGKGVDLLICLDCGSSNLEEIAYARNLGIDTIVIDHHETGPDLPPAIAVINPKRPDSRFPTRDLAACGVTFFFLLGLRRVMHAKGLISGHINLKKELDIVTIGTVGDMVPLTGDNRILVRYGIEIMNKRPRAWLRAMYGAKAVPKGVVNEFALGFIIVPRINAAGRVSRPHDSLDFLVADDDRAPYFLNKLQEANRKRQKIEEKTLREIMGVIKAAGKDDRKRTIVVFDEKWHMGVLGIVAQKLAEQFGKPTIIITKANGVWKGSGRGGEGLDLFEVIRSLSPLLLKYGGHKYACGISLAEGNLPLFVEEFERAVKGCIAVKKKKIHVDTAAGFNELTAEAMDCLEELGPFGMNNPRPNLLFLPTTIAAAYNGRVRITDGDNRTWYGSYPAKGSSRAIGEGVRIIAAPVVRIEMGERFVHLNIKEILTE